MSSYTPLDNELHSHAHSLHESEFGVAAEACDTLYSPYISVMSRRRLRAIALESAPTLRPSRVLLTVRI